MKQSTKASMSRSIKLIVILVLVMAILGLGIGILNVVKNFSQTKCCYDYTHLVEQADFVKRIANIDDTVEFRANRPNDILISFYNTKTACETDGAIINISCTGLDVDAVGLDFDYLRHPVNISQDSADNLISRITPFSNLDPPVDITGSYACEFQVICKASSDVYRVAEQKSIILDVFL